MDMDHLKVLSQTESHEQECHTEKKGYVKAAGAEVPTNPIRKSSRLQSKKKLPSCSGDVFRSYDSSSQTMKYLKANLYKDNSSSKNKIQEEKKYKHPHRNENNDVFSADTISMKSSTVVPSFKYHVRATEGIQLVVDLNLKRSDWLKSKEKAICVCYNHAKPAFESIRKEAECLGSRNNIIKVSSFDKTAASDSSMNSYVQNKFSLKSSSIEDREALPSVVEKEVITISGSKRCWSKVDRESEPVLKNSENTTVQENCSHEAGCPEIVALLSEEIHFSDFSSHQKGSLGSRTEKVCSERLVMSTSEVNQEADANHRLSTNEIKERINSVKEMEVSGREENAIVTSVSDDGRKRKKSCYKSDQIIHDQSHERILRSTKLFGGQIYERGGHVIRRSSRLYYKIISMFVKRKRQNM